MPSFFPTTYSTLSAPALALYLSAAYNWQHTRCTLLLRGVGDTYLVEQQKNRYILRVYRCDIRSEAHIAAEVELLLALRQSGVPVSYPVADKTGGFIHRFNAAEGTKHGVVFSYAPGRHVQTLDDGHLKTLGREMAKFHEVSSKIRLANDRWHYDTETTLIKPLNALKMFVGDGSGEFQWLSDRSEKAANALRKTNDDSFSKGYCHYDFMPKNFHFDDTGQITFFDFDFLGHGWLVNDLMSFRVSLSLDAHYGKISQARASRSFDIFLEAYRKQKVVSDLELSTLPYLELGFWLFYLGFYTTHDQFFPLLQEPHLKRRLELIRSLTEKNGL